MRILVAIAHYFKAEADSRHSSTDGTRRSQRAEAVRAVIDAYRGHFGPTTLLNIHQKRYERIRGIEDALDIAVIVSGDDHLLDREHCAARGVRTVQAKVENPRLLGFAAQRLFADVRHAYDLFAFTEDDLRIADPSFFLKIEAFQAQFGWRRLLQPNRFEWNPNGPTLKTFIDGDLRPDLLRPFHEALPDDEFLSPAGGLVRGPSFRRATNPHSGFYAITAEQLAHWMGQPHFLDMDCSFISPLESAASLGMMKTFSIYKPFGPWSGWLELEHLDRRFSAMQLPRG